MGLKKRFKAAWRGFREGVWWPGQQVGVDSDESDWRRLTGNADRDLSPLTHERMLKIAYYLYETDPFGKRIIELPRDYLTAEGVSFEADDERVQEVLQKFWDDPINQMDLKLNQKVLELGLWGEQCYSVFVNQANGHVRLGYLDPGLIDKVELDRDNVEVVKRIKLKRNPGEADKWLSVINVDENPRSLTYGYRMGESFYFRINAVTTASRGRSDLLALADYLDLYNQFIFNRGERAAFGNAWIWDVTLEGMTAEQIKEWLREHPVPKPGSLRAHNERVKWEAVAPDLKAHDASYDSRMIKNYVLGGAGFPEHFFAEGGETTRATAAEMGEPVIKHLTARQKFVKAMLVEILEFVLDQAMLAGTLPREIDRTFDLHFPEISSKDLGKMGTVLLQTAQALLIAQQQGWVDHDNAANLFCAVASGMGPEVEPAENPEGAEGGEIPQKEIRQALRRIK